MRSIAVVLTLMIARLAAADDVPAEPAPTVDDLFDKGRALLAAHQPAEACAQFEQAIQLDADAAGVLLNLGLCNEEQDKIATALRWFRVAQVRGSELKLAETEQSAKEHAAALVAKVPTIKIVFPTAPRHVTTVTIDGATISPSTYARIELDAGHHEVVATSIDGTKRDAFDIADKEARTIAIDAPAPPVTVAPETRPGWSQKKRALVIGAASAGLGLAALAFATYEKIHTDQQGLPPSDYVDAKNRMRIYGSIAGSVSAVGLGVATYLYFTARERPDIVPTASPTSVGLTFTRLF